MGQKAETELHHPCMTTIRMATRARKTTWLGWRRSRKHSTLIHSREGHMKLAAALGAGPGAQLTQEQYLKAMAEFVANCYEERRKLLDDLWEATYAVMDTNNIRIAKSAWKSTRKCV